jgi:hypothetical protein
MTQAESSCVICQCPLEEGEERSDCPACGAAYHRECWEENGGCGVYGCERAAEVPERSAAEIPAAWWGQERKPCPACGAEILALARRCRGCGEVFEEARPMEHQEYRERERQKQAVPGLRRIAVVVFIANLLPPLGFVAAPIGLAWGLAVRKQLAAGPPMPRALTILGVSVGLLQSFILFTAILMHSIASG